MFYKILIEAGHGLSADKKNDPGAMAADGTSERSIVVAVAKRLAAMFPVARITTVGVFDALSLDDKIARINTICQLERFTREKTLLVSLHCDWSGAPDGISGYFKSGDILSRAATETLLATLSEEIKQNVLNMRGDKESRFGRLGIVRDTTPVACLVEIGSLRKDGDESDGLEYLIKPENQDTIARGLARGIEQVTGIQTINTEVSSFAVPSVKKAIVRDIATDWKNPREIVATETVEHIFHKLGIISEVTGNGLTKERFIVALDRLKLLDLFVEK